MIIYSACEPLGSFRTMQSESVTGFNLFKLLRWISSHHHYLPDLLDIDFEFLHTAVVIAIIIVTVLIIITDVCDEYVYLLRFPCQSPETAHCPGYNYLHWQGVHRYPQFEWYSPYCAPHYVCPPYWGVLSSSSHWSPTGRPNCGRANWYRSNHILLLSMSENPDIPVLIKKFYK